MNRGRIRNGRGGGRSRNSTGNYAYVPKDRSASSSNSASPSVPPHRPQVQTNGWSSYSPSVRKDGLFDEAREDPWLNSGDGVLKQSLSVSASDYPHQSYVSSPSSVDASSCIRNLRLADDSPVAADCSANQLQSPSSGSKFEVNFPPLSAESNTKNKYYSVKGTKREQPVDTSLKNYENSELSHSVNSAPRHGQASHNEAGLLENSKILHPGVDSGLRHDQDVHEKAGKLENSQILHTKVNSGNRSGQISNEKVDGGGKLETSQTLHPEVPFDICVERTGIQLKTSLLVRNREKRNEIKRFMEGQSFKELRPGMVHLSRYLSIPEQVLITKECQKLGVGPGGFYRPGYRDGAKLNLKMMCLGMNWDPQTLKYVKERPSDGAIAPSIPKEFLKLVDRAIQESHAFLRKQSTIRNVEDILPSMSPDICVVNFYTSSGRLGLHQDKDETSASLQKGLPVVSFSIGDSAEFMYGNERDIDKAEKIILESGDVLIFGGESRLVFHGVSTIKPETAPKVLLEDANLRPGRLNLTFRQY